MSGFVNYNKRKIDLPAGCKDLVEVLKRKALRKTQGMTRQSKQLAQMVACSEHLRSGKVAHIPYHIAMIFQSRAQLAGLTIHLSRNPCSLGLFRMNDREVTAYVTFGNDPEHEKIVRGFFATHRLHLPTEEEMFCSDLPFPFSYPISPMPSDHQLLSIIVTNFFLEVCGADQNSDLIFDYFETTDCA